MKKEITKWSSSSILPKNNLKAQQIIPVQPMSLPAGLIFFLHGPSGITNSKEILKICWLEIEGRFKKKRFCNFEINKTTGVISLEYGELSCKL